MWAGRRWEPGDLPPAAALHVARLGSHVPQERLTATVAVLRDAGICPGRVIDALLDSTDPDVDLLDLTGEVLRTGTGRPWRTTVSLAQVTVRQWSMIRGRLIQKGIPDPLRSLPSLTALLDAVETMILDGAEDDKERQRMLGDLYRRDNALAPPPGWEDGAQLDGIL